MAEPEQIELILQHLRPTYPAKFFRTLAEGGAGYTAALRFLHEAPAPATAGQLSEFLQVSTARTAVLLKKMSAEGLITRAADASDARVTSIRLSEKGEARVREIKDKMAADIGLVIDQLGTGRLLEFLQTAQEIQRILNPPN